MSTVDCWAIANMLQGMEELIKQAFLHVDIIGPHVHDGHYDLVGPDGEIILPQVWETMVQPDWAITMHMWPMPEPPPPAPPPPPPPPQAEDYYAAAPPPLDHAAFMSSHLPLGKSRSKSKTNKRASGHHVVNVPAMPPPPPPPPPPGGMGHPPPPPPPPPGHYGGGAPPPPPPPAVIVVPSGGGSGGSSRKKPAPSPVFSWFAGTGKAPKKKK